MDYSFYGGRRGAAFVITGRFASIEEMVINFRQGSNYSVINYDEYVIIDTVNKNDADNGKIFRRGYNYQNDLGGAQYIGQIVGPAGPAPTLELTTLDAIKNMPQQEGFENHCSEGEYAPVDSLVPGKDGEIFNDTIKWACCAVRDEAKKETTAYVGFTFPYTVIEYSANSVDPYYNRNNDTADFSNENLVTREDDATHPFYEKWHISIPKGIKGDALKNFRIISASNEDNVQPYAQQADDRTGKITHTFAGGDVTRKIAVYDYYDYSRNPNGEPVSLYLGDYNMISDVALDDDGTVRISYTHNDDSIFTNRLKWINNVSITQEGKFTVNYNYGGQDTQYNTSLRWIDKVDIQNDGTVLFKYNDNISPDIHLDQKLKWIVGVTLDEFGTLTFQYNDNTEHKEVFQETLKWIKDITLTEDGTLTVKYNNNTPDQVWQNQFCWVTDCVFTDTGDFTLRFNNGKPAVTQHVRWIKNVSINTGITEGEGNQKFHISYNDNIEGEDIGAPLNYIMKTVISPINYHLLILYSDPARRQAIVETGQNATYDGRNDWYDCGSVKDYDGILIGANYELSHFTDTSISGIVNQLNKELPNGFADDDAKRHGRVVTVGNALDNKQFFGFDYSMKSPIEYQGWYYLGSLGTAIEQAGIIVGRLDDPTTQETAAQLPIGSVWFILQ